MAQQPIEIIARTVCILMVQKEISEIVHRPALGLQIIKRPGCRPTLVEPIFSYAVLTQFQITQGDIDNGINGFRIFPFLQHDERGGQCLNGLCVIT